MRQHHKAGEKVFVDWAGQTVPIHNPVTGDTSDAYLFVATLGATNYAFTTVSVNGLEKLDPSPLRCI